VAVRPAIGTYIENVKQSIIRKVSEICPDRLMTVSLLTEDAKGVFIISATPFADDGALDLDSTDRLIEFYIEKGVHGITILGMMGEAQKLTTDESIVFVQRVLGRVRGRVPVVVGISNPGTDNLVALAWRAMDAGAAGVMVAPVIGLRTEDQVISYVAAVFARIGAEVPVCLQDYPQSTTVHVSVSTLNRLVDVHRQLVMVKHEDCPGLSKLSGLRQGGNARRRVSILIGNGALYLPQELRRGADGAMTGFAFPEMLVEVYERFARGDAEAAEDLFDIYLPLVRYEQQPAFGLAVRKEVLHRRGVIKSAALRAPGVRLNGDDHRELGDLLLRLERKLQASSG